MKYLKKINEMAGKSIFVNKKVVDIQYNVSDDFYKMVKDHIKEQGVSHGNHSYINYFICGESKPMDEVKDVNNIVIDPDDPDSDYVYERGDDPISDYLMDNGCKMGEEVIILLWW